MSDTLHTIPKAAAEIEHLRCENSALQRANKHLMALANWMEGYLEALKVAAQTSEAYKAIEEAEGIVDSNIGRAMKITSEAGL